MLRLITLLLTLSALACAADMDTGPEYDTAAVSGAAGSGSPAAHAPIAPEDVGVSTEALVRRYNFLNSTGAYLDGESTSQRVCQRVYMMRWNGQNPNFPTYSYYNSPSGSHIFESIDGNGPWDMEIKNCATGVAGWPANAKLCSMFPNGSSFIWASLIYVPQSAPGNVWKTECHFFQAGHSINGFDDFTGYASTSANPHGELQQSCNDGPSGCN